MKAATRENLGTIRVVYCAPYTLALYGIPYEMRADVHQAPRHLWELRPQQTACDGHLTGTQDLGNDRVTKAYSWAHDEVKEHK